MTSVPRLQRVTGQVEAQLYACDMTESISVTFVRTEDLVPKVRDSIIHVCITAHQNEDFKNLFLISPRGADIFSPIAKPSS